MGIGLALISTVALAIYQHCVKRTKGVLSAHAVLALNYGVILLPALAVLAAQQWYSGATDGLAAYRALGTRQWAYLLVLSVGIYLGAMQLQLIAIRQLGPTMLAAGCRRLAPDGDSRHLLPLLWLLAAPQTLPVAALEYPWGAGLLLAPLATLPSSYTHSGSQRSCPCDCSLPYLAPRPYWASMCRAHSRRWACCLSP